MCGRAELEKEVVSAEAQRGNLLGHYGLKLKNYLDLYN